MSMRGDINQMADVTSQLLNFVDNSKSNFTNLQQHFKRFQDDTELKHKQAWELQRLLSEATEHPPPMEMP